jgi:hypothetical protein
MSVSSFVRGRFGVGRGGRGRALRSICAFVVALGAFVTPAGAMTAPTDGSSLEVQSYQRDFGVSAPEAEANLEVQEQGTGIVEALERAEGDHYAGVWFDNGAGEFVVPVTANTTRKSVVDALQDTDLEGDFRTKPVQFSWEELERGQERVDETLLSLIEGGLVQTSLDPRSNAVVITEAEETNSAEQAQIQDAAATENVTVDIRQAATRLDAITQACATTSPRACGRPLRGGVSLTPTCANCSFLVGECSAGFKALGNSTGDRYVLTAGHCGAAYTQWGSEDAGGTWHSIGNVAGYVFPAHDWAKIKATGSAYWDSTPWPTEVAHYWEDQERLISAEAASYLGEYVCHSGNASGTSCGNVGEVSHTISVEEGLIYNETEFNDICSRGGDSGGPVFAGNTAIGLYSAVNHETYGACDARGYYIELSEATDAMGVSVVQSPVARTGAASGIYSTQANLNGTVDPNGLATTYHFEYGVSTAYGINTPSQSAGAGWSPVPVAATITSLRGLSGYHFRLVATNSAGTSYGPDMQFATPAPPPSVSELAFVRFNGTGNTYLKGYVGAPVYKGLAVTGETGYPKITDPQNIQSLAVDIDGDGLDELGFIRFNGSGNTHLDSYAGAPGYKSLGSSCDTGYPKITDPQNVQAVAIDPNGDGIDDLGFVRLNSPANAHLDAYSGSCYKTLNSYCDTGYPSIADPKNVQVISIDTNGDGIDELGFVRLNSAGNAHLDAYTGPCYKTLSSYCNTGYPTITDPQNVRVLAIDTNGDGIDELGFLRYNPASGKAHLDAYTGSCYTGLLGYSDSGYPAVSDPENTQALAINLTYDPAPGGWYEDSLGGSITEDPDVSSWGANRLDVFGRASDGSYRHKWWGGSTWSGWETLGSPGMIVSGVGSVGISGNRVDAVGRTSTNSVVDMWWNGSAWLTENFGGNITGDPDFSSANGANYDIWARGASGMLEHRYWTGANWSPWESTGLAIASSPGAVSWGTGRLDVVARASDNSVLHFWWNGSKWITENMGGNIQGTPDIASWASGRLDIFARGADNTLMHKYYNGTWSAWESLGGLLASSPGAVSWGPNRIDVVARASDNTVSHWYWNDP